MLYRLHNAARRWYMEGALMMVDIPGSQLRSVGYYWFLFLFYSFYEWWVGVPTTERDMYGLPEKGAGVLLSSLIWLPEKGTGVGSLKRGYRDCWGPRRDLAWS